MKKSATSGDVEPFQVRWTNDDNADKLPGRFARALRLCKVERAPLIRTLLRHWTEAVERAGGCSDPAVTETMEKVMGAHPRARRKADYTLNEPSPKYQAKKKRPT